MNFWKVFGASILATLVAASLLFVSLLICGIGLIASLDVEIEEVPNNSILYIDLAEDVIDSPLVSPLGTFSSDNMTFHEPITILNVIAAIEKAAEDPKIKGICIAPTGMGTINTANIEELRSAIERFKLSGKFVVAYDDSYTEGQYYLASVADAVALHPEGHLEWRGLGTSMMFYKNMLDNLDIDVNIFRPTVCRYKSAVEPYFLTSMSRENRQQMEQLTEVMWNDVCTEVSESRNIAVDTLKEYAEQLTISIAEDALECRMVDALFYEDQLFDLFDELGVKRNDRGLHNKISLGSYIATLNINTTKVNVGNDTILELTDKPLVAVIYAEGQIVDGNIYTDGYVYGTRLAEELRQARLDDDTKAVVLRVNSPGGSALASDVVWREMVLLQQTKPVVVSMGSMAASGGYYISTAADYIFADHMTLTGSIGVFAVAFNLEDALRNKLGINIDRVGTSHSAYGMDMMHEISDEERRFYMRTIDRVYETFTTHVAEGRNLEIEDVLEIAEGRVWCGSDALEIGLVDEIGGLNDAIVKAVTLADLGDNFMLYEFTAPLSPFEEWLTTMTMVYARNMGIDYNIYGNELMTLFRENHILATQSGIQAIVAGDLKVEL